MRKFTKEISALIATVTVGAASVAVNAEPLQSNSNNASAVDSSCCAAENIVQVNGEDIDAFSIGVLAPEEIEPLMGDAAMFDPYDTTMETPTEGTYAPTDTLIETSKVGYTIGTSGTADTDINDPYDDDYIARTAGVMAVLDGDINTDYCVNAEDLAVLVDILLGKDKVVYYTDYADLNKDGKVNVIDLIMLKQKLIE